MLSEQQLNAPTVSEEDDQATYLVCANENCTIPVGVFRTLDEAERFARGINDEIEEEPLNYYTNHFALEARSVLYSVIIEFRSNRPVATYKYGLIRKPLVDDRNDANAR
ncbi:hypothetical protein MalM25_33100 [Planctomycetes bacterium MalM25]|nr:hypothetical protein MalM25_33100 [Planctomycetes bacterium MalM25]